MKFWKILILIPLIFVSIHLIYISIKSPECSCLVITERGEKIKATRVNWYNSGFVDVRKCGGGNITLQDNEIIKVEPLKE